MPCTTGQARRLTASSPTRAIAPGLTAAITQARRQQQLLLAITPQEVLRHVGVLLIRPELKDAPRAGTVRWYDDDKGYGRITADDGEVLLVHFSGIIGDGFRSLSEGDRVSFTWHGSVADHGRHVAENARQES